MLKLMNLASPDSSLGSGTLGVNTKVVGGVFFL